MILVKLNLPSDFKEHIRAEAQSLGFILCGFTTPEPPAHFDVFQRWLSLHRHAGMSYLASERSQARRADPRRILPDCRSVICLAIPYARPDRISLPTGTPVGRVAAYAWGKDYHLVLPPRLESLVIYIKSLARHPVKALIYTDTGPLLEKEFAQRAGLGWIGKNTCLINRQMGSYFLLAEILLDLSLEPDLPVTQDYCGSCRRCIDACPTGCILPDRTLDSARCLSYLTIENRSTIPSDLCKKLGNWVFGCDICQMVCPWNQRFAPEAGDPAFEISEGAAWLNLHEVISLSVAGFSTRFETSAVSRARHKGLLVNALFALGNQQHPDSLPILTQLLRSHDLPAVRSAAAWAISQYQVDLSQPVLMQCLQAETDPEVRQTLLHALSNCL